MNLTETDFPSTAGCVESGRMERPLERYSLAELVAEIRIRPQLVDDRDRIHLEVFNLIQDLVPLPCSDFIAVRRAKPSSAGEFEIGIITRAIAPEENKAAILGGRTNHNERDEDAVARHLSSLGVPDWNFFQGNDIKHPIFRQTYYHTDHTENPDDGFDPAKHSIACTYLIEINGDISPRLEASNFRWIKKGEVPAETSFNHRAAMIEAFKYLEDFRQ